MDFDDVLEWFSGDVNFVALGFAVVAELALVSALFFNMMDKEAMSLVPLEYKLVVVLIAPVLIYFIVNKMTGD